MASFPVSTLVFPVTTTTTYSFLRLNRDPYKGLTKDVRFKSLPQSHSREEEQYYT